MRERGLTLREKDATRHLAKVAAFGTTADIGPVQPVSITRTTTADGSLAALLISLAPGLYTAQVTSADDASGPALIESYEVP